MRFYHATSARKGYPSEPKRKEQQLFDECRDFGCRQPVHQIARHLLQDSLSSTVGDYGLGLYSIAFPLYSTFLAISIAGLPIAVSKMVAERVSVGNYKGAYRVFYNRAFDYGRSRFDRFPADVLRRQIH
jgi:hypothetical protein